MANYFQEEQEIVTAEQTALMGKYDLADTDKLPAFMFMENERPKTAVTVRNLTLPDEVRDQKAYVLEDVFTEEECLEMITWTEKNLDYEAALINLGMGEQILNQDARNHLRAMYDSHEMSKIMFDRIREHLPSEEDGYELSCLNERLRFLKYDKPGQNFAPHYDGTYIRDDYSEISYLTFILYLNEDFEGGETNFLNKAAFNAYEEREKFPVGIKSGSVLIFEHAMLHEGEALRSGTKYCVRTDVMFHFGG